MHFRSLFAPIALAPQCERCRAGPAKPLNKGTDWLSRAVWACRVRMRSSSRQPEGSGHGCAPTKLDFPTLEWEFQRIRTCHQSLLLILFATSYRLESHASLRGHPKQVGGTWPGSLPSQAWGPGNPGQGKRRKVSKLHSFPRSACGCCSE